VRLMPPEKVELAVEVLRRVPAREMPPVELRVEAERPPVKLDVALTVLMSVPPAMVRPPVEILRSVVKIPPLKLEVAVEVLRREPPVMVKPEEVAVRPDTFSPW